MFYILFLSSSQSINLLKIGMASSASTSLTARGNNFMSNIVTSYLVLSPRVICPLGCFLGTRKTTMTLLASQEHRYFQGCCIHKWKVKDTCSATLS